MHILTRCNQITDPQHSTKNDDLISLNSNETTLQSSDRAYKIIINLIFE